MPIEYTNLTPSIGASVLGRPDDLIRSDVARELRQLLRQRGVLVFKELHLTNRQQLHLASMLGTVRQEGESNVFKITLDPRINPQADYVKGSFQWHMDGTHDDIPVFASLLTARSLSSVGGRTEFANSYAAYEALSAAMKETIENLHVVHSFELSMRRAELEPTAEHIEYWNRIRDKTHKLVWRHDDGRKSLVIGCHASHVVGMDPTKSEELLQELTAWVTQANFAYRHEWTVGDLLIWDNTGVLHRAEPYSADSGRLMDRTTLMGEEAFA